MDGEIQQEAVDAAKMAMEISMESVEIAEYIKKRFDKLFMPSEHCIVGPHFIELVIIKSEICLFNLFGYYI
ncbi:unnamed protein product [Hymenolepis diminuta]|uniref:Dynein light chain n=1 Tax=Hymenolepis diminuta TaxID=6216 RepID=A0A564ZCQ0_HYMDI|nr:unnamed protein product [Hymenolepis diminuta]